MNLRHKLIRITSICFTILFALLAVNSFAQNKEKECCFDYKKVTQGTFQVVTTECCYPDQTQIKTKQVGLYTYYLQFEDEEGFFNSIEIKTAKKLKEFIGPMKLLKK